MGESWTVGFRDKFSIPRIIESEDVTAVLGLFNIDISLDIWRIKNNDCCSYIPSEDFHFHYQFRVWRLKGPVAVAVFWIKGGEQRARNLESATVIPKVYYRRWGTTSNFSARNVVACNIEYISPHYSFLQETNLTHHLWWRPGHLGDQMQWPYHSQMVPNSIPVSQRSSQQNHRWNSAQADNASGRPLRLRLLCPTLLQTHPKVLLVFGWRPLRLFLGGAEKIG